MHHAQIVGGRAYLYTRSGRLGSTTILPRLGCTCCILSSTWIAPPALTAVLSEASRVRRHKPSSSFRLWVQTIVKVCRQGRRSGNGGWLHPRFPFLSRPMAKDLNSDVARSGVNASGKAIPRSLLLPCTSSSSIHVVHPFLFFLMRAAGASRR